MNKKRTTALWAVVLFLAVLLAAVSLLAVAYGSVPLSLSEVINSFLHPDTQDKVFRIIHYVRLPRIFAALLAGSALAVSGVILQAVLNNALAGPNIIGVNAGSGLSVMVCLIFFPAAMHLTPIFAFIGALAASLLIYWIAAKTGASRITIVLAGVAVSNILSALMDGIIAFYPDIVAGASSFMVGGLASVNLGMVQDSWIYVVIGLLLALLFSYDMNVLTLGDEIASTLGMKVKQYRFVLICIASLLAAASVSIVGLLGFVGLIVPHIARSLTGNDHRFLVPVSALVGALMLLSCDLLGKLLFAPFEIPAGIIISLIGGPYFIYLLFKQRRSRVYD